MADNQPRENLKNKKWNDPKSNPCCKEGQAAYRCLEDNNYNRDACTEYFHAYKDCKKLMVQARREGTTVEEMRKSKVSSQ